MGPNSNITDQNLKARAGCSENVGMKKRGTEKAMIYKLHKCPDDIVSGCILIWHCSV
jgi:hypothetical protein